MECIDPRDGFFENNAALDAQLPGFQGQQNAYDTPDGWSSNWEHDRVNFYIPPDSDLTTACSLWDEISNASPPTEAISQRHPQTMYESFYDILRSQGSTNGQNIVGKHGLASIRDIRDDLVHLYFIHVHATLPIIDEHAFTFIYNRFNKEEDLTKYLDLVLLQAIMFSGFAHINEAQLAKTPYKSIHEGQKYQFEIVKVRTNLPFLLSSVQLTLSLAFYLLQVTTDQYILSQVSILLSQWTPCDAETQVNSYWVSRAFHHADEYRQQHAEQGEPATGKRWKLLWWCCLIRGRMLALGLRNPHRLQNSTDLPALPSEEDFGLESSYPSYVDVEQKRILMSTFIALCKLSNIMEAVAVFQRSVSFRQKWNGNIDSLKLLDVLRVIGFERQLRAWREDFDAVTREVVDSDVHRSIIVPVYSLRIISDSLLAWLYRPYLCCSTNNTGITWRDPIRHVKASSVDVGRSVRKLLELNSTEAIPNYIMSWIALPAALDIVVKCIEPSSSQVESSIQFLYSMGNRYRGARFIAWLLSEATHGAVMENRNCKEDNLDLLPMQMSDVCSSNEVGSVLEGRQAELLDRIARHIDNGLSNNINAKF